MVGTTVLGDNEDMEHPADEGETGAGPAAAPSERRLRRSSAGTIGGVAEGLASYLGVEAMFFRIGFVILTFFSGFGLVLYAAGWLLLPTDDDPEQRPLAVTSNIPSLVAGFVVLAVGSLLVGNGVDVGPNILIPLVLIMFGVWVLNQRQTASDPAPPTVTPPVRPERAAPEGPSDTYQGFEAREPVATDAFPPPAVAPTPAPAPAASPIPASTLPSASAPEHWAHARTDGPAAPPVEPGPPVVSATLAGSVVVVGALLVLRNLGGYDIDATIILGAVLAVLGAGMVVSAFVGRAVTLVVLSVLLLPFLSVAPLIDSTITGGIGNRDIQVSGAGAELRDSYSLGIGRLELDLRGLTLTTDETVEVSVGAGYTEIVVPDDLRVEVEATNRAGYIDVDGVFEQGVFNDLDSAISGGPDPEGSLTLIIDVTFGYAEVRRG